MWTSAPFEPTILWDSSGKIQSKSFRSLRERVTFFLGKSHQNRLR